MADDYKLITDDEIAGLPEDDELAFVAYEERLRARLRERSAQTPDWSQERDYANHITAFNQAVGLNLPIPDDSTPEDSEEFYAWFNRFQE